MQGQMGHLHWAHSSKGPTDFGHIINYIPFYHNILGKHNFTRIFSWDIQFVKSIMGISRK